jgi:AraC-like DNA-binding protein
LPAARVVDAWARLRGELADPAVAARAAHGWALADWGLFGFYIATAPTLRDALHAAARCVGLITERGTWRIVEAADQLRCTWSWTGSPVLDHALSNEVMVSAFARGVRELAGAPPLRVDFMHRAPAVRAEYARLLECDVRFGQPDTAVVVSRARLGAAPPAAHPRLHRFLGELATGELDALGPAALHERAAQLLARQLRVGAGAPGVTEVARNLGMSERTLRRRLSDEGVGFRALRNTAQLDRAAELLASSDASLSQIALACGFGDASAFGRAWRRSRSAPPSRSRPR